MTQKTNCLEIKKRKEKKKIKMMITKGKIEKTAKKKQKKKRKRKKKSEQNFLGRSYSAPKPVRELLSTRSISNSGPGQIENNSYFVIRARDLFVLVERPRLPIDHLETLWFHTINFRCIEFLNTGRGEEVFSDWECNWLFRHKWGGMNHSKNWQERYKQGLLAYRTDSFAWAR